MPPPQPEDDTGSLEKARENLYSPGAVSRPRVPLNAPRGRVVPHAWEGRPLKEAVAEHLDSSGSSEEGGRRHVRLAGVFFAGAFIFFLVSLGIAGYFFYFGGNTVSVDKVTVDIQGPTTITGGDTVPLSITITNKNPVTLEDATIGIEFPSGTRSADNVLAAYPRYTENLGVLASGASVTRSVKAIIFGGAGQTITLPVTFSYGTAGSNAVFVKKSSYVLAVSSTPL